MSYDEKYQGNARPCLFAGLKIRAGRRVPAAQLIRGRALADFRGTYRRLGRNQCQDVRMRLNVKAASVFQFSYGHSGTRLPKATSTDN